MEIQKLIDELRENGACMNDYGGELMLKAAETIKLLWEAVKDQSAMEAHRKIDDHD